MSYFDEILKLLQDSQEILILIKEKASLDEELAGLVIANIIQRLEGTKSVSYRFDKSRYSSISFIEDLLINIGTVKDEIPSNFVFEIQNADNKIKNIEWKKEADKISFYITAKNTQEITKSDLKFIRKSRAIDLVITIGIDSYEEIGKLAQNNPTIFEKAKIISIKKDNSESKVKGLKIIDDKASSYSEIAYEISQRLRININKHEADMLLLGIYAGTDNFKNIINPKSFSISSNLLALNADAQFANKYKDLLQDGFVVKQDDSIQTKVKVTEKKDIIDKEEKKSKDKSIVNKQALEKKSVSKKKEELKVTGLENVKSETKVDNTVIEQDNSDLQIPLQKATTVPEAISDPNIQPNFIAPPPINPVKQNTFNMPLNPKLR